MSFVAANVALTTDNLDQSVSSDLPGNPPLWISRRDATTTVYDLYINDAKVVAGNILATSTSHDKQVNRLYRHPPPFPSPLFPISLIDNQPFLVRLFKSIFLSIHFSIPPSLLPLSKLLYAIEKIARWLQNLQLHCVSHKTSFSSRKSEIRTLLKKTQREEREKKNQIKIEKKKTGQFFFLSEYDIARWDSKCRCDWLQLCDVRWLMRIVFFDEMLQVLHIIDKVLEPIAQLVTERLPFLSNPNAAKFIERSGSFNLDDFRIRCARRIHPRLIVSLQCIKPGSCCSWWVSLNRFFCLFDCFCFLIFWILIR